MLHLLAQSDGLPRAPRTLTRVDLKEVQNHFNSSQMIPVEWILLAAGLVLVAISVMSLVRWWKTRHERSNPMLVFVQVAVRMKLGVADAWLLYRVARQQKLPTPLTLLVCVGTFEHHTSSYAARCSPARSAMIQRHARRIARRLFGPSAR